MRAARFFAFLAMLLALGAPPSLAQEARQVVTSPDSDYFGFDLRSEQNVTLDRCKAICLADQNCRAFTFNTKAKWCFLKSDFNRLNPFPGAVAGKVVPLSGEADIGAPPDLAFFPANLRDEAIRYRNDLNGQAPASSGLTGLMGEAEHALTIGNAASARELYLQALAIAPDEAAIWIGLSKAAVAIEPQNGQEAAKYQRDASASAWNGYRLTRTATQRAEALAALAAALDKRELYRPALSAYESSLALVNDAGVRAAYVDLKARKGFRVVDNSIDADSASPRACVQFSEDLRRTGADYSDYVTVDGGPAKAVDVREKQLCVEGLGHGKSYRLTLRAGLPASIGEVLEAPVTLNVYVRDRAPSVRFSGDSFVLPSAMRRGIPVTSINTDAVEMQLFRINDRALAQLVSGSQLLSQLDGYSVEAVKNDLGQPVWQGELAVASTLNDEIVTSFPVDEALPRREPGVYMLSARPKGDRSEDWQSRATQWFVVSDIGLSTLAGEDGLHVFARSLDSALPLAGAELTLLARNNEVLGRATTNDGGEALFTAGLTRGDASMAPAALMAKKAGDFVFLDMTRAGFDLSDRGVGGREAPGPLDVYSWTERGIYRAGETVHGAALARNAAAEAVEHLPLTFIFFRPDGVEAERVVSTREALGGHAVDLGLEPNAMRGTWSMRVYTDPKKEPLSEAAFLVEDFVPDRIEFDLASAAKTIAPGTTARIDVAGRYLYGAPAAGLSIEGEVNVAPVRDWTAFPGYRFGLAEEGDDEAKARLPLTALPPLDDAGKAAFDVALDALPSTTRLLKAQVVVRMSEPGGRAVERSLDLAVEPQSAMIGIRPEFSGQVAENSTASFQVIAVSPSAGRTALSGAKWSLVRIERNYQWYRDGNGWNYEPVVSASKVADGRIDIDADAPARVTIPVAWGNYRLEVTTDDAMGPATSVEFDAGWVVAMSSTETPDALQIGLDKARYRPGETARLTISPRFAGEAVVTVGSDTVRAAYQLHVPQDGATLDIPVGDDWGAGAYVNATLFRPSREQGTHMPARAIGIQWLGVDPGSRKLAVSLDVPQKTEPRKPLPVAVSLANLPAKQQAYVTVAAVDVGILNLTRYATPDPDGWYFGQRRLGLEMRDLYGRLIDGAAGVMGRIRSGGDGSSMIAHGSPPTEKLVAFFSGPVEVGADGKAHARFDLPQFNGTIRVMAVAWTKNGVGHAQADVVVRDPVVVTAGAPRFMAPGDTADLRLDIANTDGPAGDYELALEPSESLTAGDVSGAVTLERGGRAALTVPLTADTVGDGRLRLRLSNADGLSVEQTLAIPVRPAALPQTTRRVVTLPPGGSLTIDQELLAGSLAGGATVSIGVSRLAAFDVPSLVMSLDRYPYGCAEQTASRALPLLYLSELSQAAGLDPDPDVKKRLQESIDRVFGYQSSAGSFGLWSPGSGDLWLDAYLTDFLTRAREKGYDVPETGMRLALSNLQNALGYTTDVKTQGNQIAYALYVLARNRQASVGDLRYYADTQLETFATPMARAQVAAALALYGDAQRSASAFSSALRLAQGGGVTDLSRADYGSALRDGAAMLALAAETSPAPSVIPAMIRTVAADRAKSKSLSTQEEAWLALAARAMASGNAGISLEIDGSSHEGPFADRRSGEAIAAHPLTIANRGGDPVDAVVTTIAAPAEPPPAGGEGFVIERSYYTLDGQPADIAAARQNERYVVVLKVTEQNALPSRVLVTDLLPAGFQIDNPHIVGSAELSAFPWLGDTEAAHAEFRDDRFVAAFDRTAESAREITLAYVARAVTPGTYAQPAAGVEDMYRPYLSARTAAGMIRVEAAR